MSFDVKNQLKKILIPIGVLSVALFFVVNYFIADKAMSASCSSINYTINILPASGVKVGDTITINATASTSDTNGLSTFQIYKNPGSLVIANSNCGGKTCSLNNTTYKISSGDSGKTLTFSPTAATYTAGCSSIGSSKTVTISSASTSITTSSISNSTGLDLTVNNGSFATLNVGESAKLHLSNNGYSSCVLKSANLNSSNQVTGSFVNSSTPYDTSFTVTESKAYQVICTDSTGKTKTDTAYIFVTKAPRADIWIKDSLGGKADANYLIKRGSAVSIGWSSENVSSCQVKKEGTLISTALSSSNLSEANLGKIISDTSVTIDCDGDYGTVSDLATANLEPAGDLVVDIWYEPNAKSGQALKGQIELMESNSGGKVVWDSNGDSCDIAQIEIEQKSKIVENNKRNVKQKKDIGSTIISEEVKNKKIISHEETGSYDVASAPYALTTYKARCFSSTLSPKWVEAQVRIKVKVDPVEANIFVQQNENMVDVSWETKNAVECTIAETKNDVDGEVLINSFQLGEDNMTAGIWPISYLNKNRAFRIECSGKDGSYVLDTKRVYFDGQPKLKLEGKVGLSGNDWTENYYMTINPNTSIQIKFNCTDATSCTLTRVNPDGSQSTLSDGEFDGQITIVDAVDETTFWLTGGTDDNQQSYPLEIYVEASTASALPDTQIVGEGGEGNVSVLDEATISQDPNNPAPAGEEDANSSSRKSARVVSSCSGQKNCYKNITLTGFTKAGLYKFIASVKDATSKTSKKSFSVLVRDNKKSASSKLISDIMDKGASTKDTLGAMIYSAGKGKSFDSTIKPISDKLLYGASLRLYMRNYLNKVAK